MIYASAGYHPHESKKITPNYLKELETFLEHEKVVALGEIGLDFFYEHSDKKTQIKVFEQQLELAKSLDIPCIIHNRESDKELLKSIKNVKNNKGVIHSFAKKLINLNLYLSFTGLITFVEELKDVVKNVPIENIMIETDSPYLTPIPYRGKRNEPYMVKYVAEKIANIKNISANDVANQTSKTARNFFGI